MTPVGRRLIQSAVIGVLLPAGYGWLLFAMTEPWRVYGNDYRPWFWTLPAFLVAASIAIAAVRFPRVWFLILLLGPLFLVSRQQIVNRRLQDSIASCGNHSAFWQPVLYDANEVLPASPEFTDFLGATDYYRSPIDRSLPGKRCPGFKRAGTQTGVVFAGRGLHLANIQDAEVLIAFCSWQSHPIPYDHQHCLSWQSSAVNGTNSGTFERECSNATNMIARIQKALEQAGEGVVPYSSEARHLLAHELEQRKRLMARAK